MRIRKGVRKIRKFAKREWDWELKAYIAAEIRRRQQAEAKAAAEAAALAKAAVKAGAEADCPF